MPTPLDPLSGVFLALASAFVWGSGDFTGGFATRRQNQYQVLALSAFSGLVLLAIAALLWQEGLPAPRGLLWSMLGGVAGALGIAALYRGLALGNAALVAPMSAVISAALPVAYGAFAAGLPGPIRLAGFGCAIAGIWLVTASAGREPASRQTLALAALAGVGFGAFFIFIGLAGDGKIFTPLVIARSFTLLTGLALMRINRLPIPALRASPYALLAGILDASGNLLYILARQHTRLDIAAVLSSLYPVSTVLLAGLLLREKITRRQMLGVGVCLLAVALISA